MNEWSLPRQYRVVSCAGGSRTQLRDRLLEMPGPGELLLSLRAVGLCGTDLFKLATGATQPGLVLGHELVGAVVALGTGVDEFALGERIAVPHHVPCGSCAQCLRGSETLCEIFRENLLAPGGFADYVLVRARAVRHAARRVPAAVHDDTAVWMEPAACVLRGIQRAQLERCLNANGVVLIQGAGSMGLLHLLVFRALYPTLAVAMTDTVPERLALALSLGATRAVTPDTAHAAVAQLSGGSGADAVFDTVGGAQLLETALALSREGASVVLFAHARAGERANFDLNELFKHERRIIGSYSGTPAEQAEIFDLMCAAKLDPRSLVTHHLPLEAFDEGVRLVQAREAVKVVFTSTGAAESP